MLRLILTLSLLCVPAQGRAQGSDPDLDAALAYMETLYDFDFEGLADHLAPDAIFRDPTAAVLAGEPLEFLGRDAILESFAAGAADSRNAGFEVLEQFTTSGYVVLTLVYRTELRGEAVGVPTDWIPVRVPAMTVLKVVDGLITEHLDHVDYEELLRQVAERRQP